MLLCPIGHLLYERRLSFGSSVRGAYINTCKIPTSAKGYAFPLPIIQSKMFHVKQPLLFSHAEPGEHVVHHGIGDTLAGKMTLTQAEAVMDVIGR